MKQQIYKTTFPTGEEATERQQRLFEADLAFAIDKGYNFIQTPDNKVFFIVSKEHLEEVTACNTTAQTSEKQKSAKCESAGCVSDDLSLSIAQQIDYFLQRICSKDTETVSQYTDYIFILIHSKNICNTIQKREKPC